MKCSPTPAVFWLRRVSVALRYWNEMKKFWNKSLFYLFTRLKMAQYTKISPLRLTKLNNAEYGAFMDSFSQLVEQSTIAKLGIQEAERTAFKANLTKMIDANMQIKKDEDSEQLLILDHDRDQVLTYFFTKIAAEMRSPDPVIETAATQLGDFLTQYRGIQKKPNRQETQLIKGLLLDAEQSKYATHLQALKLDVVLVKLKKLNEDYESLLDHRTSEGLATTLINTKELRAEMDEQYDQLSTKIFALNIITPSPETQKAIADLNKLIKATMIAWRQRNGLVHLSPEELEELGEGESPQEEAPQE